eukprot:6457788-Amphidinium_carterae.1
MARNCSPKRAAPDGALPHGTPPLMSNSSRSALGGPLRFLLLWPFFVPAIFAICRRRNLGDASLDVLVFLLVASTANPLNAVRSIANHVNATSCALVLGAASESEVQRVRCTSDSLHSPAWPLGDG